MEEHENFVRGLETHGRDWQTIAERFVPTRTPTQIRTHAQKYEKKLERAMSFSQKVGSQTRGWSCVQSSRSIYGIILRI